MLDRAAQSDKEEMEHFWSPFRQTDVVGWQMPNPCEHALLQTFKDKITSGCSDRAAEALRVGRELRRGGLLKHLSSLTRDVVHELRTHLKSPTKRHLKISELHRQLFFKKHAPCKTVCYSAKALHRLDGSKEEVIETLKGQTASLLGKTKFECFGYAPRRFDQLANPYEAVCLVLIASVRLLCWDSKHAGEKMDMDSATEVVRFFDREMLLTMGMFSMKHCNRLLDWLHGDYQDPAKIPRHMRVL